MGVKDGNIWPTISCSRTNLQLINLTASPLSTPSPLPNTFWMTSYLSTAQTSTDAATILAFYASTSSTHRLHPPTLSLVSCPNNVAIFVLYTTPKSNAFTLIPSSNQVRRTNQNLRDHFAKELSPKYKAIQFNRYPGIRSALAPHISADILNTSACNFLKLSRKKDFIANVIHVMLTLYFKHQENPNFLKLLLHKFYYFCIQHENHHFFPQHSPLSVYKEVTNSVQQRLR
eukprot:g61902.t1